MADRQAIESMCEQIVQRFRPLKVILFGSHAKDRGVADSDVDLLVVMEFEGSAARQAALISQSIPHHCAVDVMVRTPAQLEERLRLGDFFVREVMETGQVLYDATGAGVGR